MPFLYTWTLHNTVWPLLPSSLGQHSMKACNQSTMTHENSTHAIRVFNSCYFVLFLQDFAQCRPGELRRKGHTMTYGTPVSVLQCPMVLWCTLWESLVCFLSQSTNIQYMLFIAMHLKWNFEVIWKFPGKTCNSGEQGGERRLGKNILQSQYFISHAQVIMEATVFHSIIHFSSIWCGSRDIFLAS